MKKTIIGFFLFLSLNAISSQARIGDTVSYDIKGFFGTKGELTYKILNFDSRRNRYLVHYKRVLFFKGMKVGREWIQGNKVITPNSNLPRICTGRGGRMIDYQLNNQTIAACKYVTRGDGEMTILGRIPVYGVLERRSFDEDDLVLKSFSFSRK